MLKNDFFGFPKVKWLHLTGEVDKSVRYIHVKFSQDFTYQNYFNQLIFDRDIQKIKSGRFFLGHGTHHVQKKVIHLFFRIFLIVFGQIL